MSCKMRCVLLRVACERCGGFGGTWLILAAQSVTKNTQVHLGTKIIPVLIGPIGFPGLEKKA